VAGFRGKRVVLGVSGGIAAYKIPQLVRDLVQRGAHVDVVMTAHAAHFVAPLTLQVVSRNPVITDLFSRRGRAEVRHVVMADRADLGILAPATANVLGKLAHGVADDALTTVFLAMRAPTVLAPAMNQHMWEHPATAQAVRALREWGYRFVGPERGPLAEGYSGVGRMAEPPAITRAALAALRGRGIARVRKGSPAAPPSLRGVRVLVNAGPTREHLDDVRFLSNPSTGRMGFAVAAEAVARGATVTLVAGPTEVEPPPGVELVRVESAAQMHRACAKAFARSKIFVATAAVSDFRPARRLRGKVPKDSADRELRLEPTEDIVATLARRKGRRVVVGFAAQGDRTLARAREKLRNKALDLIVANRVGPGRGFATPDNTVDVITPRGKPLHVGPAPKEEIAAMLWDVIVRRLRHS